MVMRQCMRDYWSSSTTSTHKPLSLHGSFKAQKNRNEEAIEIHLQPVILSELREPEQSLLLGLLFKDTATYPLLFPQHQPCLYFWDWSCNGSQAGSELMILFQHPSSQPLTTLELWAGSTMLSLLSPLFAGHFPGWALPWIKQTGIWKSWAKTLATNSHWNSPSVVC